MLAVPGKVLERLSVGLVKFWRNYQNILGVAGKALGKILGGAGKGLTKLPTFIIFWLILGW